MPRDCMPPPCAHLHALHLKEGIPSSEKEEIGQVTWQPYLVPPPLIRSGNARRQSWLRCGRDRKRRKEHLHTGIPSGGGGDGQECLRPPVIVLRGKGGDGDRRPSVAHGAGLVPRTAGTAKRQERRGPEMRGITLRVVAIVGPL